MTGFGQNKVIFDIINGTWFRDQSDLGVRFSDRFKPVSEVTLALIFTAVRIFLYILLACISTYSGSICRSNMV